MFSSGSSCLPTPSKSTVPTTSVAKLLSICTLYVRTKVKILDKNSPTLICERLCFLTSLNKISISSVNRSVDEKRVNFRSKFRTKIAVQFKYERVIGSVPEVTFFVLCNIRLSGAGNHQLGTSFSISSHDALEQGLEILPVRWR
jgi:hypothetical protein